jgi:MFS family permease
MLVAAVAVVLMSGAHSLPALLALALVTGVVYDGARPVLGAAITELVPDSQRRARLDAWRFGWIVCIGRAITGGVGGLLAGWFGVPMLFWINACAFAMFAAVAAYYMPTGSRPAALAATATQNSSYRQAFADRRLVLLFASSLATLMAIRSLYAAIPMLMDDRGLGASQFGWVQLASALAGIAVSPMLTPWLGRKVAARFQPRLDLMVAAGLWTTVSMGAAALAHTTFNFIVAAALSTPGEIAWLVIAAGVVHRIAPPAGGGRYHGIWSMAMAMASVIAPIVTSFSLTLGGHRLVAVGTLTVGLIGAGLCLPLARALGRTTSTPAVSAERAN